MSNSRRFRRKLDINGHSFPELADDRPGAENSNGTPPAGAINAYSCTTCSKLTVVQHIDAGVTPMFLACRATPDCDGTGESLGYPNQDRIPQRVREAVRWEWYRPNRREFMKLSAEMKAHVSRGGLLLRERI